MIWCTPGASAFNFSVALPPLIWTVSRVASPSKKVTVPAGVPAPGSTGATCAFKVALPPYAAGLRLLERVTSVCALVTTWVSGAELAPE